ncbi:PTS sugar transporter subunit IIA [Geobacter sp.]|uniref:PTS sugar transporter subunit IIA n=1 Tax=Geobacter sp. TaxID=46610 RepID=UPI001AC99FD5|nr:PTS sugar transporter subunit IIA [Geobacter sp.]CAG0960244.1 Nitrogen regulatory protein [Geobacteraceae bacterium]
MLLEPSDAAQALNVDEKTVVRWIRKDNLPAEMIRGEYRINPVDLLEWATERGMKVNPALYKMHDADNRPLPTLSQALEAGGIHCGVTGTDKETVLHTVVSQLDLPPELDPDFILQVLLAREALGTTAVGDGIAIPHVRNPILVQLPVPKVSLSYLAEPVDFGALDGKPVQILFTIITPTIRMHLHLLSKLAFCLRDPRLRQILGRECNPEAIVTAVREIEKDLGKGSP